MKLHRSSTDCIVGGVCGGLGETLNVDPTIIRMAWSVLMLCWGFGVVAYLLCWLIFPED